MIARVEIPTGDVIGRFTKTLRLTTNSDSPTLRELELTVVADVQPILQAVPSQLLFGELSSGQHVTRRIAIHSMLPKLSENFLSVESTNPAVRIKVVERSPGVLTFIAEADGDALNGDFTSQLVFKFSYEQFSEIRVLAMGRKVGDLKATPPRLFLGFASGLTDKSVRALIMSRTRRKFRITSIVAPDGLSARCHDGSELLSIHLVEFTSSVDVHSLGKEGMILIQTDLDGNSQIKLPIAFPAH